MVSPPSPTEMLPFGEFPSLNGMCRAVNPTREVPFGHPQIKGCMRLPGAYRRLPRPSSALKPSYPLDGVAAESPTLALTSTCVSFAQRRFSSAISSSLPLDYWGRQAESLGLRLDSYTSAPSNPSSMGVLVPDGMVAYFRDGLPA
jgi:hypothetical protein